MAGAGYTPEQIDAMPMGDALALLRHWRSWPPANEAMAVLAGIAPAARNGADPSNIGPLIGRFPDGRVT